MEHKMETLFLKSRKAAAARVREKLQELNLLIQTIEGVYGGDQAALLMLDQMKENAKHLMVQAEWCVTHSEEEIAADDVLNF